MSHPARAVPRTASRRLPESHRPRDRAWSGRCLSVRFSWRGSEGTSRKGTDDPTGPGMDPTGNSPTRAEPPSVRPSLRSKPLEFSNFLDFWILSDGPWVSTGDHPQARPERVPRGSRRRRVMGRSGMRGTAGQLAAAAAVAVPARCRLTMRSAGPIAAILTSASALHRPRDGIRRRAELCGSGARGVVRCRDWAKAFASSPRDLRIPALETQGFFGSSRTRTPSGGSKRKRVTGGSWFVSMSSNTTWVRFPKRSTTSVSRITPLAGSTTSSSRS